MLPEQQKTTIENKERTRENETYGAGVGAGCAEWLSMMMDEEVFEAALIDCMLKPPPGSA